MGKQYSAPAAYEAKLEKVMKRLGVDEYDFDWSRYECWVSFQYKGQHYRFNHSVENARAHGVDIQYGSDVFAQVVLSLEDLARMVERGIYDLSTWVAGMKSLPAPSRMDSCFIALGFAKRPSSRDEVRAQYKRLSKVMHPDGGGSADEFNALKNNYLRCMELVEE